MGAGELRRCACTVTCDCIWCCILRFCAASARARQHGLWPLCTACLLCSVRALGCLTMHAEVGICIARVHGYCALHTGSTAYERTLLDGSSAMISFMLYSSLVPAYGPTDHEWGTVVM